jgi:2-succinyl-6-hydroxy-2,4-cyclohexadiene-1-carboxylate synthase
VDAWAALPIFDSQRRLPPEVREAQRIRRLRNATYALAACLRGLGTGAQPSFWERLGDVQARVLLITGEEDEKFTDIAREMAKSLPNAGAVAVPKVGHAVHLEDPERWAEAVQTWLS